MGFCDGWRDRWRVVRMVALVGCFDRGIDPSFLPSFHPSFLPSYPSILLSLLASLRPSLPSSLPPSICCWSAALSRTHTPFLRRMSGRSH
eukprot:3645047-Rhodomonas_salina.1